MKRRIFSPLSFFLLSTIWCSSVYSDEAINFAIHQQYLDPRCMGMGNACVASVNDYASLFVNPAALARLESSELNLSMDYAISEGMAIFYDQFSALQNEEMSDGDRQQRLIELIQENYGSLYGLRLVPAQGVYVRRGWGIGLIPLDTSVQISMHNQGPPAINAKIIGDTTAAFGIGRNLHLGQPGHLSWGVTGKFIQRGYISKSLNSIDLILDENIIRTRDYREGFTVDADVGLLYSPDLPPYGLLSLLRLAKPTFGLVVRNALDYGFLGDLDLFNDEEHGDPEKLYRRVDLGTKWEYPDVWIFGGRGVMDFRNIGHPNWNWRKGFHIGFEFDWTMTDWWKGQYRIGLHQGYLSAGFSALFTVFNLDFVTWGEDIGSLSTPKEARHYMVRLNMNF